MRKLPLTFIAFASLLGLATFGCDNKKCEPAYWETTTVSERFVRLAEEKRAQRRQDALINPEINPMISYCDTLCYPDGQGGQCKEAVPDGGSVAVHGAGGGGGAGGEGSSGREPTYSVECYVRERCSGDGSLSNMLSGWK